jgi:hypothetical protein
VDQGAQRQGKFLDYLGKYLQDATAFRIPDLQLTQYVMVTWENVTDHNTVTNTGCDHREGTGGNVCPVRQSWHF